MKRVLLFLVVLLMGEAVMAQHPNVQVPYSERYAQLYQLFAKEPDNVANLIEMATFFSQPDNPLCNYPQAYTYIVRAETLFTDLVQDNSRYREAQKVIRKGISINLIRQKKDEIEAAASAYVKAAIGQMERSEMLCYLETFADRPEMVRALKGQMRANEYAEVCRENTLKGYYDFMRTHPHCEECDSAEHALSRMAPRYYSLFASEALVDSVSALYAGSPSMQQAAMRQKSRLAYARACQTNTLESYSSYLEQYPRGDNYLEALAHVQELRGSDYSMMTSPYELADYVEANGDSPYADSALSRLRRMVVEGHNQTAARVYFSRFALDEPYSAIYNQYYNWYSAEGNKAPIALFAAENPNYPYQLAVRSDLERGAMIDTFDLTKPYKEADYEYMSSCLHRLTGRKVAYVALQRLLQQQIASKNWNEALNRMGQVDFCFEDVGTDEYNELRTLLSSASDVALTLELPADSVTHVIPSPNKGLLYYTRAQKRGTTIGYARYVEGKKGGWKQAGTVRVQGSRGDVEAYHFYSEGSKVLLGIDGDIWSAAVLNDSLWHLEQKLGAPVNTPYVEKDAFMLSDGSGILVASDRPGGRNVQASGSYFHGDSALATDIYYIPYHNGSWGEAVNLGGRVNTPYCEEAPILSKNLCTLYFITDARGLGYGDVYRVTRTDVDDWTQWSAPVSLGRNVNGAFREQSLAFSGDEKKVYLTTNSPQGGQNACYSFPAHHDTVSVHRSVVVRVDSIADYLRGLDLIDVSHQLVLQHTLWGMDSAQHYSLYKGKEYAVMAQSDWLYVPTVFISGGQMGTLFMPGYELDSLRRMGEMPVRLVRFHNTTSHLLPMAEKELENLASFMVQHAKCKVEISVSVYGSDDKTCYDLSMERAKAVRTFLSEKGIASERVVLSSYGNVRYKQQPLNAEVFLKFL